MTTGLMSLARIFAAVRPVGPSLPRALGDARALNPQPLPPKALWVLLNPQPLPPKAGWSLLNPQPLPPKAGWALLNPQPLPPRDEPVVLRGDRVNALAVALVAKDVFRVR